MIVWTLASLVDWDWSWLWALDWLQLIEPMQFLVVAIPSLIEVVIVETWMFLLEAIEVGSKMMMMISLKKNEMRGRNVPLGVPEFVDY